MHLPYWVFRLMHRHRVSRKHLKGGLLHSWLGDRILHKSLWTAHRDSLARAWLVGFPITMIPFLPGQTVFACVAALLVRGNLLLCIALQFLSTPMTAPIQLPACYFVGELVRGHDAIAAWNSLSHHPRDLVTGTAAVSLYLGAVVIGALGGACGYAIIQGTWKPRERPPRSSKQPPHGNGRRTHDGSA